MAATNGFFGNIQGPFAANEEIITKIQEDCAYEIDYISKLGIHFVGNADFDVTMRRDHPIFVKIKIKNNDNSIRFQIGITRMLELEDVQINSIKFEQDVDQRVYIDYQYEKPRVV